MAIGIPSILLHPQARYVFLAIYIVLLVVAIPYVMRKVWQTNKGKTVFGLLEGSLRYLQGRLIGLAKLPKTLPESYASIMELHTLKYDPLTHLAQVCGCCGFTLRGIDIGLSMVPFPHSRSGHAMSLCILTFGTLVFDTELPCCARLI